jgi:hypothetical protein
MWQRSRQDMHGFMFTLYLKSAGGAFRSSLAQILRDLGYESSKADPDVWLQKVVRDDGHKYYEMLLVYVDDILALSQQVKDAIKEITTFYKAKDGKHQTTTEIYLGANILKMQLPDGREVWTTSPKTYVKNSILVVERLLEEDGKGYVLKLSARNPFPTGYKPEIDVMEELDHMLASRYMQLIGISRCAVEIGRIDIFLETSLLSQHQANPQFGHLEVALPTYSHI